ncbi:hypothetical protein S7335_5205 [Synechococcus sp. PCC 7335]|nr:hypothetical protein S7335_5205 [Synechococcus sp. PCC 7335]
MIKLFALPDCVGLVLSAYKLASMKSQCLLGLLSMSLILE